MYSNIFLLGKYLFFLIIRANLCKYIILYFFFFLNSNIDKLKTVLHFIYLLLILVSAWPSTGSYIFCFHIHCINVLYVMLNFIAMVPTYTIAFLFFNLKGFCTLKCQNFIFFLISRYFYDLNLNYAHIHSYKNKN